MSEILVREEAGYAVITLNRPERMNAINEKMMSLLEAELKRMESENKVRCIILTGHERYFSTGADIKGRVEQIQKKQFDSFRIDPVTMRFRNIQSLIERLEVPVIAAISGYAVGGGLELALACDIRYVAENAKLGLTEAKVGSIPGAGGTQRLSRLVGPGRAKEMMYTAKLIDAQQAVSYGLANNVFPLEGFLQQVEQVALSIIENGPISITFIKKAVNVGLQMGLEEGLEFERILHRSIQKSEDYKEGMTAFLEKRKPNFSGK